MDAIGRNEKNILFLEKIRLKKKRREFQQTIVQKIDPLLWYVVTGNPIRTLKIQFDSQLMSLQVKRTIRNGGISGAFRGEKFPVVEIRADSL